MDTTLITIISIVTVLTLIFTVMVFATKRTNKIEEEMINYVPEELIINDRYSPAVYELVYIRRLPNDNKIWQFAKSKSQLMHDMKHKGINYLLIQGIFYKAELVGEGDTYFNIRLEDKCMSDDEKHFKSCSNTTGVGSKSLIHALGYSFDTASTK